MKKIVSSTFSKIVIAALIVACFSGCVITNLSDSNSVKAKGSRESYEFKVGEYNSINIDGACEVRYYSAPSNIVTLEVSPNLKEYYKVEVINKELIVRNTKRVSFGANNSPILTVSTPVLNRLTLNGVGNFTTKDKIRSDELTFTINGVGNSEAEIDVKSFYADVSGAGNLNVSGRADTVRLNLSGVGDLDALSLQARDAHVNLSGAGSIKVNCSDNLNINANGVGSVEYRGSPKLNLNKDGLVSVKQIN